MTLDTPRHHARRIAGAFAMLALAGCALFRGPTNEEDPPEGSPDPVITATSPSPSHGNPTNPMPPSPDVTPPVGTRLPAGTYVGDGEAASLVPLASMDSSTRWVAVRLDTAIMFVNQGLERVPIPVAVALIDQFRNVLADQREPRMRMVRTELDLLREQLTRPTLDRVATGEVLVRLGARTRSAAPGAGVLAGRVARLGDVLREAGERMRAR